MSSALIPTGEVHPVADLFPMLPEDELAVRTKRQRWVYCIGQGWADLGPRVVKIGCSANPERRLSQLQTASVEELYLVGVMPGDGRDERQLHARFASLRMSGEWFTVTDPLIKFVRMHFIDAHHLPIFMSDAGAPKAKFGIPDGPSGWLTVALDGSRIAKAKARDIDWLAHLQIEGEYMRSWAKGGVSEPWLIAHIDAVIDAHAATIAEYVAYSPYLHHGRMTSEAYDAYRRENPDAQAAD